MNCLHMPLVFSHSIQEIIFSFVLAKLILFCIVIIVSLLRSIIRCPKFCRSHVRVSEHSMKYGRREPKRVSGLSACSQLCDPVRYTLKPENFLSRMISLARESKPIPVNSVALAHEFDVWLEILLFRPLLSITSAGIVWWPTTEAAHKPYLVWIEIHLCVVPIAWML